MQNKIDLTKIPVKATATKTIKANFEGKEKEYEIRALSDGEKFNFQNLMVDGDVKRSSNIYIHLLSCGLGVQQQVAAFLFDNVNEEAIRVGDIIFEFSKIFDESKAEEAEVAEKKLRRGDGTSAEIGGYVTIIESCVEAGDLSPLAPMSIQDLIWVRVAQSIRAEEKNEFEIQKVKAEFEATEQVYMAIIDLQEICIDIDWYTKVAALKESPKDVRKLDQIKRDQLPSAIIRKQREEEARRAKMTPEERQAEDIKKFIAGEKYTPE